MSKIYFLFGLHNHQPIGNFEHVFAEAYEKCYLPLIKTLKRFPSFRFTLHHSGSLLEWIEKNRPDYIENVYGLVKRGQVEILSGGFYEPILSVLPERDAVGQLEMMNRWIEKNFGVRPRGAWLAERIWDPSLPRVLSEAGIEYTLLDDTHFYYAGLSQSDMYGYYVTERHGSATAIFPIDKFLRYSIPFKPPEDTLEYFRGVLEKHGSTCVAYGDDGEKFGVWPETHEWVFGKKWLEKFLSAVTDRNDMVETITYSEYIDRFPPKGRIYLPMASYEEMAHWSLPTQAALEHGRLLKKLESENRKDEFKKFLRGGMWDNFLVKYDESNRIHKKMIYLSNRVKKAGKKAKTKKAREGMTRELYRGQCNCPYWHGLFGGLYIGSLRHAVYHHLIESGKKADKLLHKNRQWIEVSVADFFKNKNHEAAIETPDLFVLIDPSYGATVAEISYKPASFNVSNVLTRREEEYHEKIRDALSQQGAKEDGIASIHDRVTFKEEGLGEKLIFDRFLRRSFLDHFFACVPTEDELQKERAEELSDFTAGSYAALSVKKTKESALLVFSREGEVKVNGDAAAIGIRKSFTISAKKPEILCEYLITNKSKREVSFFFGVEWNFTLLAADAPDRYINIDAAKLMMNSKQTAENVRDWSMTDEWFRFSMKFSASRNVTLAHFPVETVSQSEGGFESNYQGTAFVAVQEAKIPAGKSFKADFTLSFKTLK